MGHHHNLGLYRDDLLPILLVGDTFSRYGLPADPGVVMHVDSQGARWWAWRRTITGWVFGVGANSVPPDQWTYDGPEPPTGPPGEGGGWRHFMDPREGGNWD
jgi:hypothetical protein